MLYPAPSAAVQHSSALGQACIPSNNHCILSGTHSPNMHDASTKHSLLAQQSSRLLGTGAQFTLVPALRLNTQRSYVGDRELYWAFVLFFACSPLFKCFFCVCYTDFSCSAVKGEGC